VRFLILIAAFVIRCSAKAVTDAGYRPAFGLCMAFSIVASGKNNVFG
jgi:hypothetical protein